MVFGQIRNGIADVGMGEAWEKRREHPKGAYSVMQDEPEGGKEA